MSTDGHRERAAAAPGPANSPSAARRLRHLVRARVSEHPAIYLPFARRRYPGPSPEVISSETELVIDGYTRSATTFAVYAFQLAQVRPVRMAHHLHAPAQLIAAARMGVPVLALIRDPRGAILSQLVREPRVALRDALVAYTRFYSSLLPYRGSFVVGEFGQVTRDFGAVVRRLNQRFGTLFQEFQHTEANLRECDALSRRRATLSSTLLGFESGLVTRDELARELDRLARTPPQSPGTADAWVPSHERERAKAVLVGQWQQDDLARLRDRAQAAYREFLGLRGSGPGCP